MAECPSCGNPFPGDFDPRARAWCPRCGADLKGLPLRKTGRVVLQSEATTHSEGPSRGGRLCFFHARFVSFSRFDGSVYRVYITDSDFLFINLGISTLKPEEMVQQRAAGLGGGLVGAAAASWLAFRDRHELGKLEKVLERADEQALRQFVDEDKNSYVQPFDSVRDIRIDPRGFWSFLTCSRECVALWRFRYGNNEKATMELLSIDDVNLAIAELSRVFKDQLQVNVKYDSL